MHLAVGKEHDFKLKALDKTFAQPITQREKYGVINYGAYCFN